MIWLPSRNNNMNKEKTGGFHKLPVLLRINFVNTLFNFTKPNTNEFISYIFLSILSGLKQP